MTFLKKDIEEWYDRFDTLKYPTKIYNELVFEYKNHPKKIELLGAWKTGVNSGAKNNIIFIRTYIKQGLFF